MYLIFLLRLNIVDNVGKVGKCTNKGAMATNNKFD